MRPKDSASPAKTTRETSGTRTGTPKSGNASPTSKSTASTSEATPSTKPPKRRIHPASVKAEIIAHLVSGMGVVEAAQAVGIPRQRIPEWRQKDPEFQRMLEEAGLILSQELVDAAVMLAVAKARDLTPVAVERIAKGLGITHISKALAVPQGGKDGSVVEIVEVPDDSVAAEIGLKFLRFIQEFNPRQQVEVSGTLESRLAELGDDGPGD